MLPSLHITSMVKTCEISNQDDPQARLLGTKLGWVAAGFSTFM
ncbi:hypothetical protein [Paenibacillus solani]|nr:hypothetical protein [Paenibacillus solani]